MLLYLLSASLVGISSYLLASCFGIRKYASEIIYFFLIAFAQVILNLEILSLFKAISIPGVLILNIVFMAISLWFWNKKGRPLYIPKTKEFLLKVYNAAKKDHTMFLLIFAFIFFIAITIFICAVTPVISYDAQVYHINRSAFWALQKSLNHFDIGDARNLVMPINSEILYTWNILFCKKDIGVGFFSFFSYIVSITSLYGFLELLGYSMRKRLWAVFMLSSVASMIVQSSGTETDIMVGALVLAGTFLFALGAKKNSISAIYFSALAFALAIGTKTSAFFTIPSCALLISFFGYKYDKKNLFRNIKLFLIFAVINFIIFSSYNYILNLIHYHNPMGSIFVLKEHSSIHSFKAYLASFIRHFFLMFDFTGFIYSEYLQGYIMGFQDKLLAILNIAKDYNVIIDNNSILNRTLIDPFVGVGIIGIIVFLPATIISITKGLFSKKCFKAQAMGLFGISFYLCMLIMSMIIGYMIFNTRFLLSFTILCSPIIVLTYIKSNKNLVKYFILFYAMSYLILVSANIWSRDFVEIVRLLKEKNTITQIRESTLCTTTTGYTGIMPFCLLRDKIQEFPNDTKFAIVASSNDRLYVVKLLGFNGYKIDTLIADKLEDYDLRTYDYVIVTRDMPIITSLERYNEKKNSYEIVNKKIVFDEKKNPLMCIYSDKKNNINLGKTIPNSATCNFPGDLLNKEGYNLIGYIKTKSRREQDLQQFYFFKNTVAK